LTKFGFWFGLVFIQNGTRDDRLSAIELAEVEGADIELDPIGIGGRHIGRKRKKKKKKVKAS
jgi:hypothetical protein